MSDSILSFKKVAGNERISILHATSPALKVRTALAPRLKILHVVPFHSCLVTSAGRPCINPRAASTLKRSNGFLVLALRTQYSPSRSHPIAEPPIGARPLRESHSDQTHLRACLIKSAAFSATIIVGAFVLPAGMTGIMEA